MGFCSLSTRADIAHSSQHSSSSVRWAIKRSGLKLKIRIVLVIVMVIIIELKKEKSISKMIPSMVIRDSPQNSPTELSPLRCGVA